MEIPSFALSPVAPVRLSLSEPAKSTKLNFPFISSHTILPVVSPVGWLHGGGLVASCMVIVRFCGGLVIV